MGESLVSPCALSLRAPSRAPVPCAVQLAASCGQVTPGSYCIVTCNSNSGARLGVQGELVAVGDGEQVWPAAVREER